MFPIPQNIGNSATTSPNMVLNFTSGVLDPRVTFTRTQGATNAATYYNSSGVLSYATANTPRFDYNPVTLAAKGLLIEETRTNLLPYSSDLSNAAWLKFRASITTAAGVAPDGTLTAQNLVEDTTASNSHWAGNYGGPTVTSGTVYTVSFYAKAAGRNYITLQGDITASRLGSYGVQWSLVDGSVAKNTGNLAVSSTNVGNGWWRFTLTATASSSGTAYPGLFLGSQIATAANGIDSYTGNGYSGILIWGAQLEAGAFATSYIPTTSATVQRGADNASMTGTNFSSWFNQTQGTFVAAYIGNSSNPSSNDQGIFSCGPGAYAATNSVTTIINSSGIVVNYNLSGTFVGISSGVRTVSGKVSTSYSSSIVAVSSGGSNVVTGVAAPSLNGLTSVSFGYSTVGTLNGWISKFTYYPIALTSPQLKGLSS